MSWSMPQDSSWEELVSQRVIVPRTKEHGFWQHGESSSPLHQQWVFIVRILGEKIAGDRCGC